MSIESKVGRVTLDIMEVAKTSVANSLLEARNNGLEVTDEQLSLIMRHVNGAIESTFQNALPVLQKVAVSEDDR